MEQQQLVTLGNNVGHPKASSSSPGRLIGSCWVCWITADWCAYVFTASSVDVVLKCLGWGSLKWIPRSIFEPFNFCCVLSTTQYESGTGKRWIERLTSDKHEWLLIQRWFGYCKSELLIWLCLFEGCQVSVTLSQFWWTWMDNSLGNRCFLLTCYFGFTYKFGSTDYESWWGYVCDAMIMSERWSREVKQCFLCLFGSSFFFASWIGTVLPSLAEYVLFKWERITYGSIVAGARQEPAGMELMKRSIARHHQLRTVC